MTSFAPEGRPFLWGSAGVTAAVWFGAAAVGGWTLALAGALTVLTGFLCWFFRDPERDGPDDPGLVLAPGDGRIVEITEVHEPTFLGGRCRRISIFLSIFDVHVQRAPVGGRVAHRSYRPGGYAIAWKAEASEENEQASLGLESEAGARVLVRQIAGLVARRIVTYPREGEGVARGERIGMIRFGSRVDTFLPLEWPVRCRVGEKARAGLSVLARISGRSGDVDADGPGLAEREPVTVGEGEGV